MSSEARRRAGDGLQEGYNMTQETRKWKCQECGDEFESDTTHHSIDSCECGEAWVDHETYQMRASFAALPFDPESGEYKWRNL